MHESMIIYGNKTLNTSVICSITGKLQSPYISVADAMPILDATASAATRVINIVKYINPQYSMNFIQIPIYFHHTEINCSSGRLKNSAERSRFIQSTQTVFVNPEHTSE